MILMIVDHDERMDYRWAAGLRDSTASKMRRPSQIFRHFFNSKIIVSSFIGSLR